VATIQQTAGAKDESEHFGDFSYGQIEGLFVAFVIKIPNAFTDSIFHAPVS